MNNDDNLKRLVGKKKNFKNFKNKGFAFNKIMQVPGKGFISFETINTGQKSGMHQKKLEAPKGTIQALQPKERGDPIKKDKVQMRNIHTIMDNSVPTKNKVPVVTNQAMGYDMFYNDLNMDNSFNPTPPPTLPKGIPISFLMKQQNFGAIEPVGGEQPTQMQPTLAQNFSTIAPNPITQSISQQVMPPNFTQNMQPQMISPTFPMQAMPQQMLNINANVGNPNFSTQSLPQPMTNVKANDTRYSTLGHPFGQVQSQPLNPYNQPAPVYVNVENTMSPKEQYSPTDVYSNEGSRGGSESPEALESKQKRLSAFDRLGPQTQPKKPKLTINLNFNKDQGTREVIETLKHIPVYEREEVLNSTDPTVIKYRAIWPWKSTIPLKKSVTVRSSKTVMMMEKEQIEEEYNNNITFCMVSVKGYPRSWTKEDVLDTLLENVKGSTLIPCFIKFTSEECKFLVNRCRPALLAFHYLGFSIRKGDVELMITISVTLLNTKQLGYIPRLVLRNRLNMCYETERKLDLKEFTLSKDVSNFIYFPLNRLANQSELLELLNIKDWNNLQELDLSNNRLTSIEGFDLLNNTPHLKILDLSHNLFESIKALLPCRGLMLRSLVLEGNPLCMNYVEADYYLKVARTLFPSLRELDGVEIQLKGEMPKFKQNYCIEEATPVVEKFVEVFFRLLEGDPEDRWDMEELYHENAKLSITCRKKLHYTLFLRSRCYEDPGLDIIEGSERIVKLLKRWPKIHHDKSSFTIDVMMHDKTATLLRIGGLLKITSSSLAEDEHLIAFTRTVLLCNEENEYKICNEMLYWDEPTNEYAMSAFNKIDLVQNKNIVTLKFDTTLDDETKECVIKIFVNLTQLDWKSSRRCLEEKNWDLKDALEYFMKFLKLDNIEFLKVHQ